MLLDLTNNNNSDTQYETSTFPGGEVHIRLKEPLAEKVRIITRINRSSDIIKLCLAVDALRGCKVTNIEALIPYLPYARQDRRCNLGEAHSLKVFSKILNGLKLDKVTCYDPHSDVAEALIDNLDIIDNSSLVDFALKNTNCNLNIVSPDAGQSKKIYKVLSKLDCKFKVFECSKIRDLATTNIIGVNVPLIDNHDPILIIDDICDGGRTFIEIAKKIKEQSPDNKIYLAVSHGIFSHGEEELKKYFLKIYTTNSIRDDDYVIGAGLRPVESKLVSRLNILGTL